MSNLTTSIKRGIIVGVFGLFWGDEGKGKAVLDLIFKYLFNVVVRWQGGPNAGHSLEIGGKKFTVHQLPSGCVIPGIKNILGNNMVIEPSLLQGEIEKVESLLENSIKDRVFISGLASFITPYHRAFDKINESKTGGKIGTTRSGIGQAYADRALRTAILVRQILDKNFAEERDKTLDNQRTRLVSEIAFADTTFSDDDWKTLDNEVSEWKKSVDWIRANLQIINMADKMEELLSTGHKILAEGAQGILLDVLFGDNPYVTSSMTTPDGMCAGLSCSRRDIADYCYGVTKPYITKVGGGDFPSQMSKVSKKHEELFVAEGNEFGATTGRKRMCGYFDMVLLEYSFKILFRAFDRVDVVLTKTDIFSEEIRNERIPIVIQHIRNGEKTYNGNPPWSEVTGLVFDHVDCWKTKPGSTDIKDEENLAVTIFINRLVNILDDRKLLIDESTGQHKVDFVMIGTGPGVNQFIPYSIR
jgi:adenylosuccinate synthase